eukprot:TRINITY_DN33512_c0_g1_i1.p1 TRINITY_DN33512_c0_g1~~TRINITY_DN33512_c0_g1_i1.p1  ORF type:complete len:375 (-),score=23.35 TRINITY_DN33512_c0_g1_i1:3-1127(-)
MTSVDHVEVFGRATDETFRSPEQSEPEKPLLEVLMQERYGDGISEANFPAHCRCCKLCLCLVASAPAKKVNLPACWISIGLLALVTIITVACSEHCIPLCCSPEQELSWGFSRLYMEWASGGPSRLFAERTSHVRLCAASEFVTCCMALNLISMSRRTRLRGAASLCALLLWFGCVTTTWYRGPNLRDTACLQDRGHRNKLQRMGIVLQVAGSWAAVFLGIHRMDRLCASMREAINVVILYKLQLASCVLGILGLVLKELNFDILPFACVSIAVVLGLVLFRKTAWSAHLLVRKVQGLAEHGKEEWRHAFENLRVERRALLGTQLTAILVPVSTLLWLLEHVTGLQLPIAGWRWYFYMLDSAANAYCVAYFQLK